MARKKRKGSTRAKLYAQRPIATHLVLKEIHQANRRKKFTAQRRVSSSSRREVMPSLVRAGMLKRDFELGYTVTTRGIALIRKLEREHGRIR